MLEEVMAHSTEAFREFRAKPANPLSGLLDVATAELARLQKIEGWLKLPAAATAAAPA